MHLPHCAVCNSQNSHTSVSDLLIPFDTKSVWKGKNINLTDLNLEMISGQLVCQITFSSFKMINDRKQAFGCDHIFVR